MAHLSLAGVSPDGRRLLLVSERGAEFTVDITPALRAALRGDTTRLGQLEIQMSSNLRPREIQTRIRSGESPETVAEAAGTTIEAIMPYVAPVVAERQHVAERAQRASLRRGPGESGTGSRVLGDTVAVHLRDQSVDPTTVEWDAYRRETGRWVLCAEFTSPGRSGTARFTYDPPGNYALVDNDDARWLVGDLIEAPPEPSRDDLQAARERRLSVLPDETAPAAAFLGDDALDLIQADAEQPATTPPASATPSAPAARTVSDERPRPAADAGAPTTPSAPPSADGGEPDTEAAQHRPAAKKRGRASVPSWDEIMFGGPSESGRG